MNSGAWCRARAAPPHSSPMKPPVPQGGDEPRWRLSDLAPRGPWSSTPRVGFVVTTRRWRPHLLCADGNLGSQSCAPKADTSVSRGTGDRSLAEFRVGVAGDSEGAMGGGGGRGSGGNSSERVRGMRQLTGSGGGPCWNSEMNDRRPRHAPGWGAGGGAPGFPSAPWVAPGWTDTGARLCSAHTPPGCRRAHAFSPGTRRPRGAGRGSRP